MAAKHIFKTFFDIIWSYSIKSAFNCRFIYYYDTKSIIWNAFVIHKRSNIEHFLILVYSISQFKALVLSIHQIRIQKSHSCIYDGITSNLPIMCRAHVALLATVFSMAWYVTLSSPTSWLVCLSFPWKYRLPWKMKNTKLQSISSDWRNFHIEAKTVKKLIESPWYSPETPWGIFPGYFTQIADTICCS